jgi:hypothetical protein
MTIMGEAATRDEILAGKARVPSHVVFRAFAHETVVLNLDTGKYHGLNPTAGRMLERLDRSETVELAAKQLVEDYDRSIDEIRRDLFELCLELRTRGLLEILPHDGNPA